MQSGGTKSNISQHAVESKNADLSSIIDYENAAALSN